MSDHPKRIKGKSGEHPAIQALDRKLAELEHNELPDLRALNERLQRLTGPPDATVPDTLPAPSDSTESVNVVHVPKSAPLPKDPPAPESKE